MEIVNQLEEAAWREFVHNHPHGNIFHTPEMFQVFARTKGYQPALWAAKSDNGQVLALLLPVKITVLDGLLRYFSSRSVAYGSVLCLQDHEGREALSRLLRKYNKKIGGSVVFTELRNLFDMSGLQDILSSQRYAYEGHLNYLINLSRPLEEIWQDIRSNARRNIQKARKSGVVIEEAESLDELLGAYTLLHDVYKRIQVPLPHSSLFEACFELLHPQNMMRILLAKVEGATIGVLTLLLYKDLVYYWYTGTIRSHASFRAGDLLVWHALEFGHRNGYRLFDFGGGGKPDEEYGVRDFKAKFGGELVNFGRNTCVHSPLRLKISEKGYHLIRRFI